VCACQNGGVCVEDAVGGPELGCLCLPDFGGRVCDVVSRRSRRTGIFSSAIVVPLTGLLLLLIAGAIFVFVRKRPLYVATTRARRVRFETFRFVYRFSGKGAVLGGLTNSQSVSFRQGTNVEFGPTEFNNGQGGGGRPFTLVVVGY